MLAWACSPSSQKTEAGGLCKASLGWVVRGIKQALGRQKNRKFIHPQQLHEKELAVLL